MAENRHTVKLVAFTNTGNQIHLVADVDIQTAEDGGPGVFVLSACGRVMAVKMLIDLPHNQITCEKCRSVAKRYNYNFDL